EGGWWGHGHPYPGGGCKVVGQAPMITRSRPTIASRPGPLPIFNPLRSLFGVDQPIHCRALMLGRDAQD
ncbi:hypothetical protein EBZ35_00625, partial [bacterium]|nr:hypothetical protein [bacterium]